MGWEADRSFVCVPRFTWCFVARANGVDPPAANTGRARRRRHPRRQQRVVGSVRNGEYVNVK